MKDLVRFDNPQGCITNSDIELVAMVLQEATFTSIRTNPTWRSPFTRSENTPTVAWLFWEASIVNLAVADLLCLQSLVNLHFNITPSVFYHPGTQNTMADDVSRKSTWHQKFPFPYFLQLTHPKSVQVCGTPDTHNPK